MVKAVAAKKGRELKSHGDLWRFVLEVAGENDELRRLWHVANTLHQNFYGGGIPPEGVRRAVDDVKRFVGKMRELLEEGAV